MAAFLGRAYAYPSSRLFLLKGLFVRFGFSAWHLPKDGSDVLFNGVGHRASGSRRAMVTAHFTGEVVGKGFNVLQKFDLGGFRGMRYGRRVGHQARGRLSDPDNQVITLRELGFLQELVERGLWGGDNQPCSFGPRFNGLCFDREP